MFNQERPYYITERYNNIIYNRQQITSKCDLTDELLALGLNGVLFFFLEAEAHLAEQQLKKKSPRSPDTSGGG